jgi:para-aminobenzoate synthetase component 1
MTFQCPVVLEISSTSTDVEAFQRLSGRPQCLFLDSARHHPELGRYSYVTADPFQYIQVPVDGFDPLGQLARNLQPFASESRPELPPFQGGAAGFISYDANRSLERLPPPRCDEFQLPVLAMGIYDTVVAFDHDTGRAWIISQGFPEIRPHLRRARAEWRARQYRDWLAGYPSGPAAAGANTTRPVTLASQSFPTHGPGGLVSNFSATTFQAAVQKAIDYIHAGDIFQVNLAQRLVFPAVDDSRQLYVRLRDRNPATFAGYFDLGSAQIVSASPERFLSVNGRRVESRPIKGTRPRLPQPEADLFAASELQASEKDKAENVMIVDLMRNDLSRVCEPDSVLVERLCAVERYQFVQHLVSVVTGRLRECYSAVDLLRAAFPGGSITGAPKIRAMEIIAELEPHARGAYCGSMGFIGFDGHMDVSILIRTITASGGWWQLPVGGGIVAQSDPRQEYEETWHKAEGLIRALLP